MCITSGNQKTAMPLSWQSQYAWLMATWLTCQAIADLVIFSTMVVLLRECRTGFKKYVGSICFRSPRIYVRLKPHLARTDAALNNMVLWMINTGVVTTLLSVVLLVIVGLRLQKYFTAVVE